MDLLAWMGRMLARFVGVILVLYGLLLTVANLVELIQGVDYTGPWWLVPWILGTGVAAIAGGTLFILTFDGPDRFATRGWRGLAIVLMFMAAILPSNLAPIVAVLGVLMLPSLFLGLPSPGGPDREASSDG